MADLTPLLPALVALVLILITRRAALSLFAAVLTGSFLLAGPWPVPAVRCLFEDHYFPALKSDWNLSAIIFTFALGAFATLLEKGGGFTAILQKVLAKKSGDPQKKLLFGIYGLGLLCFFDGLANSVLLGRVGRPLTDALRISRQFLAYLIDSTAAPVACVAFISTWIATQLSLIKEGLQGAPFDVNPASLFFQSIPANPYCLLSLLLIPLVIYRAWHIGPMKNARPVELDSDINNQPKAGDPKAALIPLVVLVTTLPGFIYLWQDGHDWSWRNAFSSDGVPYAMVASGFVALIAAFLCFPKDRRKETGQHMLDGAASLMPALIILMLAWTLGSIFKSLEVAELIKNRLGNQLQPAYLPLSIFVLGTVMSFLTGTSWGTMGLLMPLALPLGLELGSELPPQELMSVITMIIGAVFGGAVFGDHCSPFSDTTIVSALAAGCSPTSHIATQLPYALIAAAGATLAYTLMALGLVPWLATLLLAGTLTAIVLLRKS
ncbi:hypothetical protein N9230_02940 [Akkermansiaceae bacterium]|nr:hypothetical protein [Akkermansiaceae bacterium]